LKYQQEVNLYKIHETEKADIVVLGDSLTYRMKWNELSDMPIINRGIDGDTTKGVLYRMDLIYKLHPKKVFIMVGINDIITGHSIEEVFSNYKKILQSLKEKNIIPYVQSTLFTTEDDFNIQVEKLNISLKEYCNSNKIIFIDINEKLAPNNTLIEDYTYDGVHLNDNAYKVWKQEIMKYFLD